MSETKYTFCRICESLCGLEVEVENNQIIQIKGDQKNIATQGYSCTKGRHQQEIYQSPDRLKYPLKKVDGKHVRITWEQAISEIGAKVNGLTKAFSKDSIAMYVGTAAAVAATPPRRVRLP